MTAAASRAPTSRRRRSGPATSVRRPTIIYDPATGNPDGTGRRPFPNNRIPANRISPVAQRLLDKIPMPNVPGAPLGAINYEQPYVRSKTTNQFDIKLTYQAAASDNLAVRYSRQSSESSDPGTFGENGIWGGIKDYAGTGNQPSYNYSANYNRVWSSTLIQEIRTGQSYYRNIAITDANGMNLADEIGIPGANLTMFTSGAPTINIPAYHAFLLGTQNSLPWDRAKRTTNVATNVTKIWGNHTLKVGGEFRNTNDFLDQVTHPRGEFTFTGAMTAIPTDSAAQNGYANQMAAFLLDVPREIERGIPAVTDVGLSMDEPHRGGRHKSFWSYVHDKWQVHPNITLDLGLRHEYLHALGRVSRQGRHGQLRPGNQPAPGGGLRQHSRESRRTELLEELRPAHGHLLAPQRRDRPARGLWRERAGVAGRVLPRLPDRTEPTDRRAERLRAGGLHGHGHSGPLPRADSGERHSAGRRRAAHAELHQRDARTASQGADALVERGLPADAGGISCDDV